MTVWLLLLLNSSTARWQHRLREATLQITDSWESGIFLDRHCQKKHVNKCWSPFTVKHRAALVCWKSLGVTTSLLWKRCIQWDWVLNSNKGRYKIAIASQPKLFVLDFKKGHGVEKERALSCSVWKLIPSWKKPKMWSVFENKRMEQMSC